MTNIESLLFAIGIFLLGAIAVYLIKQARAGIKGIEDERLAGVLSYTLDVVEKVVGSINQTIVDEEKKNGTFNTASAKRVKEKAIKDVDEIIGNEAKNILQKGLGDVSKFYSNAIESEVRKQK